MAKIKIARKSISLDMTAMCDVAFLLLTFFMLTTKFKPEEPVAVDTPSSTAETILPDVDIMTITVDKEGKVYFGVDSQITRQQMLDEMAKKYNITFTDVEKQQFMFTGLFGSPMQNMKQLLNLPVAQRKNQPGIPVDSTKNELRDWVNYARYANRKIRIVIKGDKDADYKTMKNVINTMQDQNINKFNLITNLEGKPKES
jgi:biopolymer transport protein ExbD